PAERAIGEGSHPVFPAPWQNVALCLPLEEVEWRLGRGFPRNPAEAVHGCDREVGNANLTDLPGLLKIKERFGRFFIGGIEIRPMDLVKIYIVGTQSLKGKLNLRKYLFPGRVAEQGIAALFKACFCCQDHLVPAAAFGNRSSNY